MGRARYGPRGEFRVAGKAVLLFPNLSPLGARCAAVSRGAGPTLASLLSGTGRL